MSRCITKIQRTGEFTQGSIFSNFVDHGGVSCLGLVVSARCDIEQSKYKYITVLPVYALEDWVIEYGDFLAREKAIESLKTQIADSLAKCDLPEDSISIYGEEPTINAIQNKKGSAKLIDKIKQYKILVDHGHGWREANTLLAEKKGLIKDIINGRQTGLYFLAQIQLISA